MDEQVNDLQDALRRSAPGDLARTVLTREVDGAKLSLRFLPARGCIPATVSSAR